MKTVFVSLFDTLFGLLRSRAALHLEILALRQQLAIVADRDGKRFRFRRSERIFWVWLYRLWPECMRTLMIFKPGTLVRWHRKGFRLYWTWKSRRGQGEGGRPAIDPDVRKLIRTMSRDNIGVKSLSIEEVLTAPRSPWQSPYVERVIGSIRRECLNHVVIFSERHLRRLLKSYFAYYLEVRTHLSLDKQCPVLRKVEESAGGKVVAIPHVGGLHHEYRRAA